MYAPLVLFCCLPAVLTFPISLPSWFPGRSTPAPPPPTPTPIHCGPHHLSEEFTTGVGTIPQEVNIEIGQIIAKELAEFVNVSYSESGLDKKSLLYVMEVGSFLEMSYIMRVDAIARSFVSQIKTTEDDNTVFFKARRVANKIENWAEDLLMLELEARTVLHKAMATPFRNETAWRNSTIAEKEQHIWKIIQSHLC